MSNKFDDVIPCFSVIPTPKAKITPSFLSKLKAQNPTTKNELLLAIEQAVDEGYIATKENKMGEFNERLVALCFTQRFKVQNLPPGERCGLDGFFIFKHNGVKHAVIYDAKTSKVWGNSSSRAATNWKLIKGTDQAVSLGVERNNVLALVVCLGLYEPTSVKHNHQGFTEIAGNAAWELCTGDPFFLPMATARMTTQKIPKEISNQALRETFRFLKGDVSRSRQSGVSIEVIFQRERWQEIIMLTMAEG